MKSEILYKPSYAMIKIDMAAGDNVDVEAGSMVAMSTGLKMKTSIGGNRSGFFGKLWAFFSALFRKIFGGETMFINRYSPPDGQDGTLYVAPSLNGDIIEYTLDGSRSLLVQSSSYLASSGDVTVKTKWGGIKSLFSGEGAFWLLISGTGTLWVNSYGAIQEIDVSGEYVVDTGHVVA
ncbi:MAG: TIGR00266 family protein, partial [Myxococcales bacterium]|nr:TIGR00266 family protein [Myxococcales bacterium]